MMNSRNNDDPSCEGNGVWWPSSLVQGVVGGRRNRTPECEVVNNFITANGSVDANMC